MTGVLGLPWLAHPVSGWALAAPLLGAVVSGLIGLLNAVLADQGLGDVKLAAVIGAWMAHLGLAPWVAGVLIGPLFDDRRGLWEPAAPPPCRSVPGLHTVGPQPRLRRVQR